MCPRSEDVLDDLKLELEKLRREREIEASLERIRSRTISMVQSDELGEVINIVFREAGRLGFGARACDLVIIDPKTKVSTFWISGDLDQAVGFSVYMQIKPFDHPHYKNGIRAWRLQKLHRTSILKDEVCYSYMQGMMDAAITNTMPPTAQAHVKGLKYIVHTEAYMKYGYFRVASLEKLSKDDKAILVRFANVFEQTYTRFLDLQKAEEQAREAQIEAALERVRTAAMAMHESDEMRMVIASVFEQLKRLGYHPAATSMAIYNEDLSSEHWFAGFSHDILPESYNVPYCEHPYYQDEVKGWQDGKAYDVLVFEGEKKAEFLKWLFKNSEYRNLPKAFKRDMRRPKTAYITNAYMKYGFMEIVSYEPTPDESISILIRFAKVFEQCYTRFLDLKKAEAQAREAQIETALERVRATSMAMHKSKDLHKVINVVYHQLAGLGLTLHSTQISDNINDKHTLHLWLANNVQAYAEQVHVPITRHVFFTRLISAVKNGESFFTLLLSKRQKDNFTRHIFENSKNIDSTKARQDFIYSLPGLAVSVAIGKSAILTVCRFDATPYQPEENEIIKRFSKVFDQTYTRFLDLQKAEAQAREAQIEAALERVRTQTMAMHNSDQLRAVISTVFEQLKVLDFDISGCGLIIFDKATKSFTQWISGFENEIYPESYRVPYFDHPYYNAQLKSWQSGKKFETIIFEGELKRSYDDFVFNNSDFKRIPSSAKRAIKNIDKWYLTDAFMSHGMIELAGHEVISNEQAQILRRFANVFDQTYTRFLDLQKAEAQAREAQIEAALERVRAAGMAMHHTEEIQTVIEVVCQQLSQLEIRMNTCTIAIKEENKKDHNYWGSTVTDQKIYAQKAHIPYMDHPIHTNLTEASKKGNVLFVDDYSMEETKEYMEHCFKQSHLDSMSKKQKQYILSLKGFARSIAFSKYSSISLINFHREKYTNEENEILKRFSKVFDQTYTRFLDLQKAEAQAREAQIEAALERIRSRSMAMHDSEELGDVASLLYKELIDLGISNFFNCGLIIVKEAEGEQYGWLTQPEGAFEEKINLPYPGDHVIKNRIKAWKAKQPVFFQKVGGKTLARHLKYVADRSHSQHQVETFMPFMPDPTYFYCGNFSEGYLHIITGEELGEEAEAILARFTNVFEQTYTRFLDLQKAEAQTREAQIEAALERVRAASMAMHQSEDLFDVVTLVFDQLSLQGIQIDSSMIIENHEDSKDWVGWTAAGGQNYSDQHRVPYLKHDLYDRLESARRKGLKFLEDSFSKAQKDAWFTQIFTNSTLVDVPDDRKKYIYEKEGLSRSVVLTKNVSFTFFRYSLQSFSSSENELFKRFAHVFEQSYARFLDLQKAEEQAREARIEAALEKVRSASMAMHKSDNLINVATIMHTEIKKLGMTASVSAGFALIDEEKEVQHLWSAQTNSKLLEFITLPLFGDQVFQDRYDAWKRKDPLFSTILDAQQLQKHLEVAMPNGQISDRERDSKSDIPETSYFYFGNFEQGYLQILSSEALSTHYQSILARFAKVFEQTYTRFLDLQKAEAQAREAQIEAALERVRSASMAMHKSDDLNHIIATVFEQLATLGMGAIQCEIILIDPISLDSMIWPANEIQNELPRSYHIPNNNFAFYKHLLNSWQHQQEYKPYVLKGRVKSAYEGWLFKQTDWENIPTDVQKSMRSIKKVNLYGVPIKPGIIEVASQEKISDENFDIIRRFARVFDQSYTRYLDLQKAEAQAREAQIEAALERVRAASMSMHKTEDLSDVLSTLFQQFDVLEINPIFAHLTLFNSSDDTFNIRLTDTSGERVLSEQTIDINAIPEWQDAYEQWKVGDENAVSTIYYSAEMLPFVLELMGSVISQMREESKIKATNYPEGIWTVQAHCIFGYLGINVTNEPTDELKVIIAKFAKEFGRLYQRFLDLQKAEAQAREARIEASMERVRSRAMAMHRTDELNEVVGVIFEELKLIGFDTTICSIGIYDKETKGADWWSYIANHDLPGAYHFPYLNGRWFKEVYDAWVQQKPYLFIELLGAEKDEQTRLTFEETEWSTLPNKIKNQLIDFAADGIRGSYVSMKRGMLEIVTESRLEQDQIQLLQRFTKVIDLTYTRVDDLEQAEAREKEALRQASLDRIRAEISSMRNTEDLQRITPLIWKELTVVGISFFRCGVFIMNEKQESIQVYLADPEGEALTTLNLPFASAANLDQMMNKWKAQEVYTDAWNRKQYLTFFKGLMEKGHLEKGDLMDNPPVQLHLQFFPFQQGMLYIGSEVELSAEDMQVVKRMASTFQSAYNRYEDFIKIESTLSDLKSTQTQLIHSEKMASLGELTAGIAHEIQNPLNFVNNFSDISGELIDEAVDELNKNDVEEVKEILSDLKNNLEKISHHGGRASGIVKGMLDHSRNSSGGKVPTDINALADEYLRLSYHGLRAKDKSFNCALETHFDPKLKKIQVIPQDIGRVLLNVFNNAFYACTERSALSTRSSPKALSDGSPLKVQDSTMLTERSRSKRYDYKPLVSISTKHLNNLATITIKDNGIGMSQETIDKVFQPFFTTKPTGEGTGLGMSISYDIITKGHGGTIEVKSKEGEGTEFTIELPVE